MPGAEGIRHDISDPDVLASYENFRRNVIALTDQRHWSMNLLAGLAGVQYATFCRFMVRQAVTLTLHNGVAIAKALDTTVEDLLTARDWPAPAGIIGRRNALREKEAQ